MLPEPVKSRIEKELGAKVVQLKFVGGGSIIQTARIETTSGNYFVKWNNASLYPNMFETEKNGLALLKKYSGFAIPEVISLGDVEGHSYLLLTFIGTGPIDWQKAGRLLATMHNCSANQFGLDHDNYIGSLPQSNTFHDSWSAFFTNERILPQVKRALDSGALDRTDLTAAENFCKRIVEIFPNEKPALLHGDLWSGNILFSSKGPSIFDPAVYFGNREMDIAMTKLFGGFDTQFYEAYNAAFPLEKNWQKRVDYCNLYPLLVHVNLFGGGYVNDVRNILSAF